MASAALPEFIALKSPNNNKFLGYCSPNPDHRGFLKFEYDDIWSPYVKLQVVNDKESGFISIRSCYNNKCLRRGADSFWIVAGEDSPNSDQSSPSCTLFEFAYDNTLSLRMVQCNKFAADWRVGGELDRCLYAVENTPGSFAKFLLLDMDNLIRLPKQVCFKGDNGKYLRDDDNWLLFTGTDVADEQAKFTVHCTADGTITVENPRNSEFWLAPAIGELLSDALIFLGLPSSTPGYGYHCEVLQPVKVNDDTVALRCLSNGMFCKRATVGRGDGIFASAETMESATRLVVREPAVVSRRVYSIEFDKESAFIYDLEPLVLDTATATNDSSEPGTLEVPLSYTKTTTQSWNNSFTVSAGIETTFETGIPVIAEAGITVSASASYAHDWGGEITNEETVGATYTATVDPGKTVVVDAIATQGKCDVKFSYVQEDILSNGDVVKTVLSDGVFRGMNAFNFDYHIYDA